MQTTMADQRNGGDGSAMYYRHLRHVVTTDDMQHWTDTVPAQRQQLTELLKIVRANLVSPVVPVEPTTIVISALEIRIVSATTTTIHMSSEMFSVVVPAEISVNATHGLTEDNRKRKKGKGLKKTSEGSNSSGLEIPVTTTAPCVHTFPLAPVMTSKLPSMSPTVMVSPIIDSDFACRSRQIMLAMQQFQQAQGNRDQYALGQEQKLTPRMTELTKQMRHMTRYKCGQEGHIMSGGPQSGQILVAFAERRRPPACYRCRQVGHIVRQCPQAADFLQVEIENGVRDSGVSSKSEIDAQSCNLASTEKSTSVLQMWTDRTHA
ncbi:hypothetical protein Scep_030068 [Stephania cephalantha]|uniref:CCHC-type domain-containing protein n=1 Tax=Stephania cephalantha TaxID=152367 RepID=A0AAP0E3D3_9MAGN